MTELFKLIGRLAIEGVDDSKKDLEDVGNIAKDTANTVDDSTDTINESNKKSGSSWSNLKNKVNEYKSSGMSTSQAWKKASQDMKADTESASGGMVNAFKKIGLAIGTFLAAGQVIAFGKNCLQVAADLGAMNSQFTQVFGDLEGKASGVLTKIADSAGIVENRMKGSFTKIAAFAKTTGMDTETALQLSERAMIAVADSAAFYDRTLEETTESLQSFLKGNFENDAALGLSCTETTRNAAANKLYGKSFKDLSEEQKQLTLLQMVEDANKASGALGQAARESDTWTNVLGNLKQGWADFQAVLGEVALPVAIKLVKGMATGIGNLADKTKEAIKWCKEHETTVKVIGILLGTAAIAVGAYSLAMNGAAIATGIMTGLTTAFGAVMAFVTSPVTLVVLAIGALIAIVVACYKKFEGFRNLVNSVAKWIKTNLVAAFEFLKPYIEDIVEAIGELVSAIKDRLLQAFQWIVDKVKKIYKDLSPVLEVLKTIFKTTFENIKVVAETVFGFMKTFISTALEVIKNVIKTVTAVIKGDWKGAWDGIKAIFKTIWNGIKSFASGAMDGLKKIFKNNMRAVKDIIGGVLDGIKSKFSSIFDSVRRKVSDTVDKLKNAFKFKWSLPKLKIPKITVKGGEAPYGIAGKGHLPSFSIKWYKKAYDDAMMLNNPTIFGYSAATGQYLGGGDGNGTEVVAGSKVLMEMIQTAVATQNEALVYYMQKIIQILADFFPQMLDAMCGMGIVLDDGTLVGRLAPQIDMELGRLKGKKDRGR